MVFEVLSKEIERNQDQENYVKGQNNADKADKTRSHIRTCSRNQDNQLQKCRTREEIWLGIRSCGQVLGVLDDHLKIDVFKHSDAVTKTINRI